MFSRIILQSTYVSIHRIYHRLPPGILSHQSILLRCTAEAPPEHSSSFRLTVFYQITCVYTLTLSFSLGFLLSQIDVNGAQPHVKGHQISQCPFTLRTIPSP